VTVIIKTSNNVRFRAQRHFYGQQIGKAALQQHAREVNCTLTVLRIYFMDTLLSLKFQCLLSVGNTGYHIENFAHVFHISEDKNRRFKKIYSLISGRKAIFVRAWLTLVRAVPVHCLGSLTSAFRARAVRIHNVESS
jgi:hypothetical protein